MGVLSTVNCVNCGQPATRKCNHKYTFSVCNLPVCGVCGHTKEHDLISAKPPTGKQALGPGLKDFLGLTDALGDAKAQGYLEWQMQQEQLNAQQYAVKKQVQSEANKLMQQFKDALAQMPGGNASGQSQGQGSGGSDNEDMSMHWNTPEEQMDVVKEFFAPEGYELDPCYNPYALNKGTKFNWTCIDEKGNWTGEDSLTKLWYAKSAFVNPPYGRCPIKAFKPGTKILEDRKYTIKDWLEKCALEFLEGRLHECVALIPVATDTEYWQDVIFGTASAVCFVKKRIKFKSNPLVQGTASQMKNMLEMPMIQPGNDAPKQANAYVYWGYRQERFEEIFGKLGHVDKIRKYVEEKPYVEPVDIALLQNPDTAGLLI